jgi:tRNA threonylcarbamoyladenosine biosynthesis protein TsaE
VKALRLVINVEVILSNSVEETEAAGARLAGALRGGECVALYGDLGAGKTQFVRGLVKGLGGAGRVVSSPTFVLLNVYERGLRLAVYHLDAYRVSGSEELEAIGFAELLGQGGVVVVEWAQRVEDLLPAGRIDVQIEPVGETSRKIWMNLRSD